ncbi:hypothetical protein EUGRSUZ_G00189 [Eucalyptus grandis]|uniref:Uncharacterized protein n=2 Tax=Eucalyptus grandis TaxID=71139 RepID=A0ACC3K055_EUCGR|nr:hypothetical protein EUGRSUZ_G00189 [Eucalyptus grandis]
MVAQMIDKFYVLNISFRRYLAVVLIFTSQGLFILREIFHFNCTWIFIRDKSQNHEQFMVWTSTSICFSFPFNQLILPLQFGRMILF